MAKKKDEPKKANEEENIIEEEKAEEKSGTKDYNSIFDDDYVDEKELELAEDPEEEKEAPEVEEESEEDPEPEEPAKKSPKKKEKQKVVKKKSKGFPTKKVLIVLAILLALLVGVYGGMLYFKNTNKPKEEATTTTTTTKPKEASKDVYVTADNGLNLRENPDSSSKSLAIIPNGTKLTVLEEKDGWYKVEYEGKTGWVSKDFVSEKKPDDMKTYTGTGFSADAPKFSIQYPTDWTLNGYKVSKTVNGKEYKIALGEGGHGFAEDDPTITSTNEDVTYNGLAAKKTVVKKSGNIILVVVNFTKGNDYTNIEFTLPDGYDQSYLNIFEKMLATFKYL